MVTVVLGAVAKYTPIKAHGKMRRKPPIKPTVKPKGTAPLQTAARSASSAASTSAPNSRCRQARLAPHARPGARNPVQLARPGPRPAGAVSMRLPAPVRWGSRRPRVALPRCCCASRTQRWCCSFGREGAAEGRYGQDRTRRWLSV